MNTKLVHRDDTIVKGTRALLYGRLVNSPFIVSAQRRQALLPIDRVRSRESSLVLQFDSIYDGRYVHEELECVHHTCIYLEEENTVLLILIKSDEYDKVVCNREYYAKAQMEGNVHVLHLLCTENEIPFFGKSTRQAEHVFRPSDAEYQKLYPHTFGIFKTGNIETHSALIEEIHTSLIDLRRGNNNDKKGLLTEDDIKLQENIKRLENIECLCAFRRQRRKGMTSAETGDSRKLKQKQCDAQDDQCDNHVGKRIGKEFDGKLHYGTVCSFDNWWHVKYDDGDQEDMDILELEPALILGYHI
jgi:hypothetical protein